MPKKQTRNAHGGGTIRQRPDGTWEARYTVGRHPGTGKQIQKSVYAKTQSEVRKKLNAATAAIDEGTYNEPSKMTVGRWLDVWLEEYNKDVKPRTLNLYTGQCEHRIKPALAIMKLLQEHRRRQREEQLKAGAAWNRENDFVFTDELGNHLARQTVYNAFKRVVKALGIPDARFHDMRHSYAVAALQSGDDVKTVQENLGHHTAAFTLDVYGHVTEQMKQASAERMDAFIKSVSKL